MATPAFTYQDPFPTGPDSTEYRLLSREGVSVVQFDGTDVLKVEPSVLSYLSRQAMHDCSFTLREKHLKQVASILDDPEAS